MSCSCEICQHWKCLITAAENLRELIGAGIDLDTEFAAILTDAIVLEDEKECPAPKRKKVSTKKSVPQCDCEQHTRSSCPVHGARAYRCDGVWDNINYD